MNKLKFNSQTCTTKEQSQRLLQLGLDPKTADCYNREEDYGCSNWIGKPSLHGDVPAWSLHRLIEIGNIENVGFSDIKNAYDTCISMIASHIKFGLLNKEYLKQ